MNPEPTFLDASDYGVYTSDNGLVNGNEATQNKNLIT